MKFPPFALALAGAGLMFSQTLLVAQTNSTASATNSPRMVFPEPEYNFGKIAIGQAVYHTFIVSNAGNATLVISDVRPGCHCTKAGVFTSHIAPGKTGDIPLKFDSTGVHGNFSRDIFVAANDPIQPRQTLKIHGNVWSAVDIVPQFAYINVMPDNVTNSATVVHIYNRTDTPMTLSDITSANSSFTASVAEVKPGKEFDLTVRAVPPLHTGNTGGSISIKTSLTNMPMLDVTVMASMQQAIGTAPTQIVVPPELTMWVTNLVSFAANKREPLVLSDPKSCCDPRIKLDLKALNPGRVYQMSIAFPPGYKETPGQDAQVSVKSNYPEEPEIVVPIRQYPRQMIQPAPGARRSSYSAIPIPRTPMPQ